MESVMRNQIFKLFIGGLTIETTEAEILNHFSKFGFVFDILIIRNRETSISKGYGFISCNNVNTYQRILSTEHVIDGRIIDCHDSFKKNEEPEKFKDNANKKIFVGGLSLETTDQDLADYFSQFGCIRQAYVIKDPVSRRSKKFGFAIMKTQDSVDKVLDCSFHVIKGIPVSCKLFVRLDQQSGNKSSHIQAQRYHRAHPSDSRGPELQAAGSEIFEDGERNGSHFVSRQLGVSCENQTDSVYFNYHLSADQHNGVFVPEANQGLIYAPDSSRTHRFSRFMRQVEPSLQNNEPFRYDSQHEEFKQEFGTITDGYVAPMILDNDDYANDTKIKEDPDICHDSAPRWSRQFATKAPGIAPTDVQTGLANMGGFNVDDVLDPCDGTMFAQTICSQIKIPVQAPSHVFVEKEPPPPEADSRDFSKGHQATYVDPNQQGIFSTPADGYHDDPALDSNVRYNLCRSIYFYTKLRSRKLKAK